MCMFLCVKTVFVYRRWSGGYWSIFVWSLFGTLSRYFGPGFRSCVIDSSDSLSEAPVKMVVAFLLSFGRELSSLPVRFSSETRQEALEIDLIDPTDWCGVYVLLTRWSLALLLLHPFRAFSLRGEYFRDVAVQLWQKGASTTLHLLGTYLRTAEGKRGESSPRARPVLLRQLLL